MFKRLKTALLVALMPLGMLGAVGGITAGLEFTGAAPAFANDGTCPTGYTGQNWYTVVDITRSSTNSTASEASPYYAFPGSADGYYSEWELCWKSSGKDASGNYYGNAFLYNEGVAINGTGAWWGNSTGGWIEDAATGPGTNEEMTFHCRTYDTGYGANDFYLIGTATGNYMGMQTGGYFNDTLTYADTLQWGLSGASGFCGS